MNLSPSRSGTVGSQPSAALAFEMSGLRRDGSSAVFSLKTISALRVDDLLDDLRELEHGELDRVADVEGAGLLAWFCGGGGFLYFVLKRVEVERKKKTVSFPSLFK